MSHIKEIVENPHRVYKENFSYWNFLLESYEGGIDYTKAAITQDNTDSSFIIKAGGKQLRSTTGSNLFSHKKERNEDFKTRIQMSYYYNFCSPIIDIYTNHLFKQPIRSEFGSIEKSVDERQENIDRKGSSIGEFRKETADLSQIYGHIFVAVDNPNVQMDVFSLQDKIDNGIFPYFTHHHPQNVLNWSLDSFGKPYWVIVREILDGNAVPEMFDKDNVQTVQYRMWTRNDWQLFDKDFNLINEGVHGLGVVPICAIYNKQSKKARNFLGVSEIADISFIARDVYNSCSELREILRNQTFAFLALQGTSDEYDELTLGVSKALLYPEDRNLPQFVSPPNNNAEVYFNHIDRQVQKMFQLAKLEGGSVQPSEGQSAVVQSGASKAWDFNQTNSALSKKAGNLEDGEMKLWQVFALWEGKEFDGTISYPNEFSIQSLNQDLDEAEKVFKLNLGQEFNKEVKKAIIKKKFPRATEEELEPLMEQLDGEVTQNGNGRNGNKLSERLNIFGRNRENANVNSNG